MSDLDPIRTALKRATRTVTLKPAFGQRTYANTATVRSGLACNIAEGKHDLISDVPPGMGGSGQGASPSMLFRSAVSGCLAIGLKMWAARQNVPVEEISVTVETDVDARGQLGVACKAAPGFEAIRVTIEIASNAPAEAIGAVIEKTLRTSPMIDAISGPDAIDLTTHIRQSALEGA
ncbi:MAG: OsmC family protein [Hyphomonadaceae bacterium]|nr:OsmC family protein [Hyphomonadaceae bacterium]